MQYESIHQLFEDVSKSNADRVAYRYKKDGEWLDVTWGQSRDTARKVSKSLMALGIEKGTVVIILGQTRLEWVMSDLGIVSCGGVTVGIYPSTLPADCAYIINHSEAGLIFVENADQLEKILSVRGEIPRIRHIVIYDGASDPGKGLMSWYEFLGKGNEITDQRLDERARSIRPDELASLVYTSGTTGVPKGAMISNGNLVFSSESASEAMAIEDHFVTLLFLPLAHVFARLIVYTCLKRAITIAFAEEFAKVPQNLREIRPHYIASVPRVFEKVYDTINSGVKKAGGLKEKLFNWSLDVGLRVSRLKQQNKRVPTGLGLKYALATRLVFRKIQAAFGGRMEWAISGAAPLNKNIAEFFHACGILIVEGIGMTENTSFSNINRIDNNKFGTVGPVGPGIEMKVTDDGEILFRGPNVMQGYFKNPDATAETIDQEGWLHSGDIGEIDEDGFLKITDRKKDLIITAGGKNVAPQRVERTLRMSAYISQVVAVGDKRKFISALVTLDPENVSRWCRENGVSYDSFEELAASPKINELIESEVEEHNKELASFESVKKFRIIPKDFSIEGGELTPSLKIKRKVVVQNYDSLIEEMYRE